MEDGQVDRDALAKLVVVHVAAERTERTASKRFLLPRRDTNASEHRPQCDGEIPQPLRRRGEAGNARIPVDLPVAVVVDVELGSAEITGLERRGDDGAAADRAVTVQAQADQLHGDHVSWPRAVDVERASQWIAAAR